MIFVILEHQYNNQGECESLYPPLFLVKKVTCTSVFQLDTHTHTHVIREFLNHIQREECSRIILLFFPVSSSEMSPDQLTFIKFLNGREEKILFSTECYSVISGKNIRFNVYENEAHYRQL